VKDWIALVGMLLALAVGFVAGIEVETRYCTAYFHGKG
jgi:hypothetical protein